MRRHLLQFKDTSIAPLLQIMCDRLVSRKSTTKENGTRLRQAVLSPNTSKGLRLNALQSETEKTERLGRMHLCIGLMSWLAILVVMSRNLTILSTKRTLQTC